MNWIYKNHELKTSGCYNMNFLFNNGKFYIMDNHLAAAWCWLQKIDTSKRYGLFHCGRHSHSSFLLKTNDLQRTPV